MILDSRAFEPPSHSCARFKTSGLRRMRLLPSGLQRISGGLTGTVYSLPWLRNTRIRTLVYSSVARLRSRRRCIPSAMNIPLPAERGSFLERVSFVFWCLTFDCSAFLCHLVLGWSGDRGTDHPRGTLFFGVLSMRPEHGY